MGLTPPGLLTSMLTVLRASKTPNGAGGWTTTWASVGTVRGRIVALRSRRLEQLVAGQPTDADISEIYADVSGLAVNTSDRIEGPDGAQYEVVAQQRQDGLAIMAGRRI